MKRFICIILCVITISSAFGVPACAEETSSNYVKKGNDAVCENVTLTDNGLYYVVTTRIIPDSTEVAPCAPVQPYVTESYRHEIYSKGNVTRIATFISTITGKVHDVNPTIISIQGSFKNVAVSTPLSCKPSYSDNLGYANIYLGSALIAKFSYKINTEGEIINFT